MIQPEAVHRKKITLRKQDAHSRFTTALRYDSLTTIAMRGRHRGRIRIRNKYGINTGRPDCRSQ